MRWCSGASAEAAEAAEIAEAATVAGQVRQWWRWRRPAAVCSAWRRGDLRLEMRVFRELLDELLRDLLREVQLGQHVGRGHLWYHGTRYVRTARPTCRHAAAALCLRYVRYAGGRYA